MDRVSLSITNGWKDKEGRVYIIFTAEEASQLLGKTTRSITSLMKDLNKDTGIGLIERKKQGLGKPDLIFVKNFASLEEIVVDNPVDKPLSSGQEEKKLPPRTGKSCVSREENISGLEEKNFPAIKTYPTNTKNIKTDLLKPTSLPNPQKESNPFPQLPKEEQGEDGWLDLETEENRYLLNQELETAFHAGQGEVTRLLYQSRDDEKKLEGMISSLLGMKEMDYRATFHEEYTSFNLNYRARKLYARALLEMLTSEKLTKTKDGYVSYAKVIEKLAPHVVYSDMDEEMRFDSISCCTVMAYLEASKDSEVKFPIPYMKSCIWTTLCEGTIRSEADFHYRYG